MGKIDLWGKLCQEIVWLSMVLTIFGVVVVRVHPLEKFDEAILRAFDHPQLTHIESSDSIMVIFEPSLDGHYQDALNSGADAEAEEALGYKNDIAIPLPDMRF